MADFDVIVIGGGAAGLVCGGFAAKSGAKVLIAEKRERPARKILVTGKGRCNVTNNCTAEEFIKMVFTNPRFMYSSYSAFNSQDTMRFFESMGVPLMTERGNRVYPRSEKATDIADALVKFARQSGVELPEMEVQDVLVENGSVKGIVTTGGRTITAAKIVIATGGKSYPKTGSTGDGYRMAESLGHTIMPLRPSLVPIIAEEKWTGRISGLSLKNVTLSLFQKGKNKPLYKEMGEMLFTHFGVSGPLVLKASAYMSKPVQEYSIEIDLKPALTTEQLDARVLKDFEENNNRDYMNSLSALLPNSLISVIVHMSEIPPTTKVNQITKEQREKLVDILKHLKITPKALHPIEEAVVTAGGVCVKEINPSTMESKLVKGLYFAGEVIDVDAFTGGFNLQIAFSTGHAAGVAAGNCE